MGKSINGEDLGKGYYQKANGLYYVNNLGLIEPSVRHG